MKGIGLYIHIPFCVSKCSYCDFFSMPCAKVPDYYIERLIEEHEHRRKQCIGYWSSVYVGGGTPSMLSSSAIQSLFLAITPFCLPGAEITFECNPSDVTEKLLYTLKRAGVTRISLGIQSFSDKKLQFCARRSGAKMHHKALKLIQKAQFLHFSADMIVGLPPLEDDLPQLIDDIEQLISYKVDHISLYSLCVEEGTPLYYQIEKNSNLIDKQYIDELWIQARNYLEKKGFMQYEVSNFARDNAQSKHNMLYWNMKDYAGIGSGATGTFYREKTVERYTNTMNLSNYLQKDFSIQEERLVLSEKDYKNEFLMMGFRKREGVSPNDFYERFGTLLTDYIEPTFTKWLNKGQALVLPTGNYALTSEGLLFLNSFLLEILQ